MSLLVPKKYALCVGLNYPNTQAALAGCINDAMDWHDELVRRGYEVITLFEPTKAELVAALKGLVARARYRDRIVFTFSGHGTWLPDHDGDEADGRDEALVCADYLSGRDGLLTDDEILVILGEARYGVRRLVIPDCCHSGTVSRTAAIQPVAEGASEDELKVVTARKRRFLPPAEYLDPNSATYAAAQKVEGFTATSPSRSGAVLLSGCTDFEFSYDTTFNGRPNGAFTRVALDALAGASPTMTLKSWHAAIRKRLPSTAYPQSPELTASAYQQYLPPL